MTVSPAIWWVRRDMRLTDNPALLAAIASQRPVIPVFIRDEVVETHKAAPLWRLGLGVDALARRLEAMGSRLILRRGPALATLQALVAETGAQAVYWQRLYDPTAIARDTTVKEGLKADGISAVSTYGHTLTEPWTVQTGQGGFYRVYSPYFRAVWAKDIPAPEPAPAHIPTPDAWPQSEDLASWQMGRGMARGAEVVRPHLCVGETAAADRLAQFVAERVDAYKDGRDMLAQSATSGLSEPLTYGEISPRSCLHAVQDKIWGGSDGALTFAKELIWRDFAHHLVFHTPHIVTDNWRPEWYAFPWSTDPSHPDVLAWQRGRTGMQVVDAAMREMYVTGRMHNRARMLVASYLTKHLMTHWRIGLEWFEQCLVDWDPASNAMGWQWSAGSGPDATPYFRVFNPETQAEKFDKEGRYRRRWLAEITPKPTETALSYFEAIPKSWSMRPGDPYPNMPIVDAVTGRKRALAAYEARGF